MDRRLSSDCRTVSDITGIGYGDVVKAVSSFFCAIDAEARRLPFNTDSKIYSKDAFDTRAFVKSIPSIGRIGTSYSRYLKWRRNESRLKVQERGGRARKRLSQDDIENIAGDILSGKAPRPVHKRKPSEMYKRVWIVSTEGKRLARQIIKKEDTNVQDKEG